MKYLSVCAGIEAATHAWHPMGWQPAGFSEIDQFPRALLAHHYPDVPLHGDFTTIGANDYGTIDLLVGGTPCQAFSVAGLRKGFTDDRGNLTLEFLRLAQRKKPKWILWENVPGVLSIDGGRAFAAFLGGLGQLGYGFAYRVLDAQYFGVPQRRRRVFVVGCAGSWQSAAAVLFERESLQGDIVPQSETQQSLAGTITASTGRTGGAGIDPGFLTARMVAFGEYEMDNYASAIKARDYKDATDLVVACKAQPIVLDDQGGNIMSVNQSGIVGTLRSETHGHEPIILEPALAFKVRTGCEGGGKGYLGSEEKAFTMSTNQDQHLYHRNQVRRLTPLECERLQGFSDNYTLIPYRGKPATDAPRYKALGNSMAVPVMRWIGDRINKVDNLAL